MNAGALVVAGILGCWLIGTAEAQTTCTETPEGRVCSVQQPIVGGGPVDVQTQRDLGLVTVRRLQRNAGEPVLGLDGGSLNRKEVALLVSGCVYNKPRIIAVKIH